MGENIQKVYSEHPFRAKHPSLHPSLTSGHVLSKCLPWLPDREAGPVLRVTTLSQLPHPPHPRFPAGTASLGTSQTGVILESDLCFHSDRDEPMESAPATQTHPCRPTPTRGLVLSHPHGPSCTLQLPALVRFYLGHSWQQALS